MRREDEEVDRRCNGTLARGRTETAPVAVVDSNGLEIAYRRVGEGPAVVFVHGAAEDGRVWEPQLAALADEFSVVAWDEPGAGRSSSVPSGLTLRTTRIASAR